MSNDVVVRNDASTGCCQYIVDGKCRAALSNDGILRITAHGWYGPPIAHVLRTLHVLAHFTPLPHIKLGKQLIPLRGEVVLQQVSTGAELSWRFVSATHKFARSVPDGAAVQEIDLAVKTVLDWARTAAAVKASDSDIAASLSEVVPSQLRVPLMCALRGGAFDEEVFRNIALLRCAKFNLEPVTGGLRTTDLIVEVVP